jgi:hypothetical protein
VVAWNVHCELVSLDYWITLGRAGIIAEWSLGCLPACSLLDGADPGQVSKDAELLVLRYENAVLRRQVGRIRYQPASRPAAACGTVAADLPPPSSRAAVHGGRDPKLVICIVTENPGWGTGERRASWSGWATRSRPPRCGRSCTTTASIPRLPRRPNLEAVPDRPGPQHHRCRLRPR